MIISVETLSKNYSELNSNQNVNISRYFSSFESLNYEFHKNNLFKIFILKSAIEFSGKIVEVDIFFRQSFDVLLHQIRFDV